MYRFLFFLLLLLSINLSAQENFLVKLGLDSNSSTYEGFEVLDDFIGDKKMVFSGENHLYAYSNNALKYKQAMYLYDKGFRYLTLELGAGIAYLSNEYVKGGDDELLMKLFDNEVNENNPYYWLLERFKAFNKGKDLKDQIQIRGMDFTRYPTYSLKSMMYILEKNSLQDSLEVYYENITVIANARENVDRLGFSGKKKRIETFDITKDFRSYTNELFQLSIKKLTEDYEDDVELIKAFLNDEDFKNFNELMEEIKVTLEWYTGEGMTYQIHTGREIHIAERVQKLLKEDSTAKISGQFGRCHIRNDDYYSPCYSIDLKSFVERLESDSTLQDEIATMPIMYKNQNEIALLKKKGIDPYRKLLENGNVYIYKTSSEVLEFEDEEKQPEYYFINTMELSMDNTISADLVEGDYRQNISEIPVLGFAVAQKGINYNQLNNDLGSDFIKNSISYGIGWTGTDAGTGGRFGFSVNFISPIEKSTDSSFFRFTNWSFSQNFGVSSIYRKRFSLYHDFRYEIGFAKLKQENSFNNTDFIYGVNSDRRVFKNPYFNIGLSTGFQLKFQPVSFFAEATYMLDISKKRWRNNGIISQSSEQNFSTYELRAGIIFFYREKWTY